MAAADYDCDFDHAYTLEEIVQFPLILLERKASSRLYLDKYFLQNGYHLNPEIELGAKSAGGSWRPSVPAWPASREEFVKNELASGKLRKLQTDFNIPPRSVDPCVLARCAPGLRRPAVHALRPVQSVNVNHTCFRQKSPACGLLSAEALLPAFYTLSWSSSTRPGLCW